MQISISKKVNSKQFSSILQFLNQIKSWDKLQSIFRKLPTELVVRVKILPKDMNGRAFGDKQRQLYIIEIDPRQHINDVITTFFHELAHIKQFLTGSLLFKQNVWYWYKEKYALTSDYQLYLDLPWEIGARNYARKTTQQYNLKFKNV